MSNLMQQCIDLQPQALNEVLLSLSGALGSFLEHYKSRPIKQVYMIGSGSSSHAANMARYYMEEALQMPVFVTLPTQINFFTGISPEETLIIAVSQSGRSSNTIKAVNDLKEQGYMVTAVAQEENSPLAKGCDIFVPLNCGEEPAAPKTMGVMGTIFTLQAMAANLAHEKGIMPIEGIDDLYERIEITIADMPENIAITKEWYTENANSLKELTHMFIVGQEALAPIGMEGALKLVETIYLPVFAYDFEEFIHGPQAMFISKPQMLFLSAPWADVPKTDMLIAYCESVGGITYKLEIGTQSVVSGRNLTLKSVGGKPYAPYALLLPMQIISAYLSEELNINIDESVFPSMQETLATKL